MNEKGNLAKFIDVGNILEKRRTEVGFTVEQIAKKLKLGENIIRAIESGEVEEIMQKIYYQGLVCQYAKIIGLKEEKIMQYISQDIENINNQHSQKILNLRYKSYIKVSKISLKLFYSIGAAIIIVIIINSMIKKNKVNTNEVIKSDFSI
ncbi:helix-turn-helix domain-containing protein [Candidatus Deianiraea vastatrix]|uniref:RodZ-like HTH domain protein n=1 Tax=Candidatus Deianiraea vastatrix TaxID=2163644 RepID=A0A5B8XFQ1_9RICK|nr:helix-turn-helix domain-containing protein [Candidatus Deianiraea vastatrix]QED23769.1 Putative RodZ-like HTH domain protein [Candidatus Deianiraea vastatrix]